MENKYIIKNSFKSFFKDNNQDNTFIIHNNIVYYGKLNGNKIRIYRGGALGDDLPSKYDNFLILVLKNKINEFKKTDTASGLEIMVIKDKNILNKINKDNIKSFYYKGEYYELPFFVDQIKLRYKTKNFESEELANIHYTPEKKTGLKGVGFANMGNTCYQNGLLQVLYHTPLLRRKLIKLYYELENINGTKHKFNWITKGVKPAKLFDTNIVDLTYRLGNYFSDISKHIKKMSTHTKITGAKDYLSQCPYVPVKYHIFTKGTGQEDASEYFNFLFAYIIDVNIGIINLFSYSWDTVTKNTESDLTHVFEQAISHTKPILELDIIEKNEKISMHDLITNFFSEEQISGYGYPTNKSIKIDAIKYNDIKTFTASTYLMIYIKRFIQYPTKKKINRPIQIHDHIIINKQKYILYGVIIHVGVVEGGHYYCHIKHIGSPAPKVWITYDDASEPHEINDINDLQNGYFYFYYKE